MSIMSKEDRKRNLSQRLRVGALALTVGLSAVSLPAVAGQDAENARVTVASAKSFDDVTSAVKSLVASSGMMVMAEVDQGKMLSMTGLNLQATLLLIGSPTVGKQLFEQNPGVGLYVPLRIAVYAGPDGATSVQYDKPSALLGRFENEQIDMIAKMLDERISGLATMATQ